MSFAAGRRRCRPPPPMMRGGGQGGVGWGASPAVRRLPSLPGGRAPGRARAAKPRLTGMCGRGMGRGRGQGGEAGAGSARGVGWPRGRPREACPTFLHDEVVDELVLGAVGAGGYRRCVARDSREARASRCGVRTKEAAERERGFGVVRGVVFPRTAVTPGGVAGTPGPHIRVASVHASFAGGSNRPPAGLGPAVRPRSDSSLEKPPGEPLGGGMGGGGSFANRPWAFRLVPPGACPSSRPPDGRCRLVTGGPPITLFGTFRPPKTRGPGGPSGPGPEPARATHLESSSFPDCPGPPPPPPPPPPLSSSPTSGPLIQQHRLPYLSTPLSASPLI